MGELLVDFGQMQAAAGHIDSAVSALHSRLEECEQAARPLVATWAGDAQAAYQQRQTQWTNAAHELTTVLTRIKKALEESTQDYMHTEKTNTNLFTG
jgi:6 kDa early secretory antigenic target